MCVCTLYRYGIRYSNYIPLYSIEQRRKKRKSNMYEKKSKSSKYTSSRRLSPKKICNRNFFDCFNSACCESLFESEFLIEMTTNYVFLCAMQKECVLNVIYIWLRLQCWRHVYNCSYGCRTVCFMWPLICDWITPIAAYEFALCINWKIPFARKAINFSC